MWPPKESERKSEGVRKGKRVGERVGEDQGQRDQSITSDVVRIVKDHKMSLES